MIKIPTHSKSEPYKQMIDDVVSSLPKEAIEKINKNKPPFVFLVGQNEGDHFNGIIVLNTELLDKKTEKYKKYAIAHELAHFFLDHPPPMKKEQVVEQEEEANAKVKEWGFEP